MKKIYEKKTDFFLVNDFSLNIDISVAGMYCIEIHVSAKSWWQNTVSGRAFLKKDSATIQLNKNGVISISKRKKLRADDLWNGNVLMGVTQTVYGIASLPADTLELSFTVSGKPTLHAISVYYLEDQALELRQLKTEKRDRAPWLSFVACQDLNFSALSISALAPRSKKDDDDIQLKIDGGIVKNENQKSHKAWYWCGKILKGSKKEFQKDFTQGNQPSRIDIIADGAPEIERVALSVKKKSTFFTKNDVRQYTYKGVRGNEDYNRFDNEIVDAVNEWNAVFNDEYPPPEPLHPNLVKAIIYVESKMGYYKSQEYPSHPDVMQVADPDNPAIHTLNNDGWRNEEGVLARERWWSVGAIHILDYRGSAGGSSPRESIYWGVRWLYHKNQGITTKRTRSWSAWKEAVAFYNGGGDPNYVDKVYDVYRGGIDQQNRKYPIKLFLPGILILMALSFSTFGVHAVIKHQDSKQAIDESLNSSHPEDVLSGIIPQKVRMIINEKMKLYERQDSYYYGTLFKEAADLCHQHDNECASEYIFASYLDEIISKSRNIHAFQEAIEPFNLVDASNSFYDDFDNDAEPELVVVLMDSLNRAYLNVFIVDQKDDSLHVARERIERPYINGTPRVIDLTDDGIPEIVVFSTGGRQDVQAYVFQYIRGKLIKLLSIERGYLHADIIFTDQNGNHTPEIMVRGEQYGGECMACNHAPIEEVFEYDTVLKKFILLSTKLGERKDGISRRSEN